MDLLKEIGAVLGFVAFAGLIVLVFITFQQARHLRRLREWAGRSPERAEADAARAATNKGEAPIAGEGRAAGEGRVAGDADDGAPAPGSAHRLRGELAFRYEELNRRLPVSPVVLFGGLLALLAAAIILTGGFGLFGSDAGSSDGKATTSASKPDKVEVAVLNGTAPAEGEVGIPGTAKDAAKLVEDAGFAVGEVGDAPPFPASTIMFEAGFKSDARELAGDLTNSLGETATTAITPEIQDIAKGADLVLIVGADDQGLAG
jgi:LytR cell envelope-related transcriptional attenuator